MKPYFTVFTPTHNRAHLLPRLHKSLSEQSYRDFEWIVIDDGSTDNTKELIEQWKQNSSFPILYMKQENSGKHVAINRGAEIASGLLFMVLDSDDWLTQNSLFLSKRAWENIPENDRINFAGIWGLNVYPSGEIVGNKFPKDVFDSNTIEIQIKYGSRGDKTPVTRTDVRKKYSFPENVGKYCPLSVVWNRIATSYKTRFINEPLQYTEYQPDGLTSAGQSKIRIYPKGYRIRYKEFLEITNIPIPLRTQMSSMVQYIRSSFHQGVSSSQQFRETQKKILWLIAFFPGLYYYVRDTK